MPSPKALVIQQTTLGIEEAQRAVTAALEAAAADGRPMAVVVVDRQGDLIACARMDGAPGRVLRYAMRKAYTAAVMGRDTLALKQEMQERNRTLADYGDPLFTTLQGGLVVRHQGEVVGGLAVGGNTQQQDEAIAHVALAALGVHGS